MKKYQGFWNMVLTFLKIGTTTFGGGYAMIAVLKEEFVSKKKWLSDSDMLDMIAISESTPGPIAINMATFIGYKLYGILGSIAATLSVCFSPLVIIFIISLFFDKFMEIKIIANAFLGIKMAVVFLILKAGISFLKSMEKNLFSVILFTIVLSCFICFDIFSVSFASIFYILIGAVFGIIIYGITRQNVNKKEEEK